MMRRACVDQTGIGRQFAERGTERFGHRCEGINFTGPMKEELAYPLKAGLEDRTFRVPPDKAVESDFRSIRKETTASGNVRERATATPPRSAGRPTTAPTPAAIPGSPK